MRKLRRLIRSCCGKVLLQLTVHSVGFLSRIRMRSPPPQTKVEDTRPQQPATSCYLPSKSPQIRANPRISANQHQSRVMEITSAPPTTKEVCPASFLTGQTSHVVDLAGDLSKLAPPVIQMVRVHQSIRARRHGPHRRRRQPRQTPRGIRRPSSTSGSRLRCWRVLQSRGPTGWPWTRATRSPPARTRCHPPQPLTIDQRDSADACHV